MELSSYRCPRTGAPLDRVGDRLVSADGSVSYAIRDGVAVFQDREFVSSEGVERLDALNRRAGVDGWRSAIADPALVDAASAAYITDASRHAYVDFLAIDADTDVLEIGCSMGQCSVGLARRARSLHLLDIVRGQAGFARLRCRQEGAERVAAACGGEDSSLPFRDASFDVVVFNLVLEWCAGRTQGEHEAQQARMLAEIARVLRPAGRAWISTKNRFALRLLCGGRDEHMAQMRFGSALPRWIGGLLLRRRGVSRAEGYLHSHARLRRLLLTNGFARTEAFWALPDARHPVRIVPADAVGIAAARSEFSDRQAPGRWVSRLMRCVPASLVKHVAAGNSFVAHK